MNGIVAERFELGHDAWQDSGQSFLQAAAWYTIWDTYLGGN